jgi:hypothetical protein
VSACVGERETEGERRRESEKGRRESEGEEGDSRSERKRTMKRDNDGESQREEIARAFACVCMLSSYQHTCKCTHALTHARTHALTHARTPARTQPEYFLAEEQLSGLTSSLRFGASDTSCRPARTLHAHIHHCTRVREQIHVCTSFSERVRRAWMEITGRVTPA